MSFDSVRLADIATLDRTSLKPEDILDDTKYLGLEHVETGGKILSHQVVKNGDLASSKFKFSPKHILYGKLRPYLAKIASPDFSGICSTDIIPILPTAKVERNYLLHFLRQSRMVDFANSQSTGANLPRLSLKSLAEFKVPLPPLPEQKRIAAILDQADALRKHRRRALDHLNQLGQSIFYEMFGDPRTNPMNHPVEAVGAFAKSIVPGRDKPKSFSGSTPWITTGELVNLQRTKRIHAKKGLSASEIETVRARVIPAESVIMTCVGDLGVVSIADEKMVINQQLHSFQCSDALTPEYLMYALSGQKQYMIKMATSTTLPYMNKTICNGIPIQIPGIETQKKFSKRGKEISQRKNLINKHLALSETLFASLQQRAFCGEL